MIEIEIDNSYSRIKGLTTGQFASLKKDLSYRIDTGYGSGRVVFKSLLERDGSFPTGLLRRVLKFTVKNKLEVTPVHKRNAPSPQQPFHFKSRNPAYKAQEDAVMRAVTKGRGTISMPTGTGKSRVIGMVIAAFNLKALVVVPSLEIKHQLEGVLQAGGVGHLVRIENIDSKALQTATNYDILIIDEAHHVASKTYQKLNRRVWNKIYYRFFFTATPYRNNDDETLLFEAIAGSVIYHLTYKDAIGAGYIVPVEAYYIDIPKKKTNAYTYREVYRELVVNNKERNENIVTLLKNLQIMGASTLCLVKEIAHGKLLCALTGFDFVNGQDEESREFIKEFNERRRRVIIGTTGILGEGVDTKPCEYVIIACGGKAKSAFLQQVGRAVRVCAGKKSAKVILFRDASHKFLLRHFNAQCNILKDEFGIVPTKLE